MTTSLALLLVLGLAGEQSPARTPVTARTPAIIITPVTAHIPATDIKHVTAPTSVSDITRDSDITPVTAPTPATDITPVAAILQVLGDTTPPGRTHPGRRSDHGTRWKEGRRHG